MADTRPDRRIVDPTLAVRLDAGKGRADARDTARRLIAENTELLRLLGVLLERTGPVELSAADLADAARVYEVQRFDSHDGTMVRWAAKRVAG